MGASENDTGNFNQELDVTIEIPLNSESVKYEIDGEILRVDRFLPVSMYYPCNYGFIRDTLGGDGDPLDVLVITRFPIVPNAVIKCKIIGMLVMEDEKGMDEKILAVPVKKVDLHYSEVESYKDLPKIQLSQIEHFFSRYKDLEEGKFVKVLGWKDKNDAVRLVSQSKI